MRTFDYSNLADRAWDNEIVSYLTQIHEYKGKQDLYIRQKPVEFLLFLIITHSLISCNASVPS